MQGPLINVVATAESGGLFVKGVEDFAVGGDFTGVLFDGAVSRAAVTLRQSGRLKHAIDEFLAEGRIGGTRLLPLVRPSPSESRFA